MSEKYKVRAVFDVDASSPEQARQRVELTMPFFEGNPFVASSELEAGLPNVPEVTAAQIIRYISWQYANSKRLASTFTRSASDSESELADHYRAVALDYTRQAAVHRETLDRIRDGTVATWIVGGEANSEIGSEVVAHE